MANCHHIGFQSRVQHNGISFFFIMRLVKLHKIQFIVVKSHHFAITDTFA